MLEAVRVLASLDKQLRAWELERLLGGPYDQGGAVLSIQVTYVQGCSPQYRQGVYIEGVCSVQVTYRYSEL